MVYKRLLKIRLVIMLVCRKIKELQYLRCAVRLEYARGAGEDAERRMEELFARDSLPVEKKTKKGMAETDIRPMIRSLETARISDRELELEAVICAREPSLNPQLLVRAVERHLPELAPDFSWARRIEVYDGEMRVFR